MDTGTSNNQRDDISNIFRRIGLGILSQFEIIIIVLGVVLILVSIFISIKDLESILVSLIKEFGIILTIVGLAIKLIEKKRVDQFTKVIMDISRERINEITTASIKSLIRGTLPEDFFPILSEMVFEQNFVRRDIQIEFELASIADTNSDFLRCTLSQSYRVRNIRGARHTYDIFVAVEVEYSEYVQDYAIRHVRARKASDTNWRIQINNCHERTKDGIYVVCLEHLQLDGGEEAIVLWEIESVVRRTGSDTMIFTDPSHGVKITVRTPLDIDVKVEPAHPNIRKSLNPEIDQIITGGQKRILYRLDEPILPYWSINWHWGPTGKWDMGESLVGNSE